ncbi:MAG TPA: hypothetical protein VKY65_00485 [Alphaproteobacteria bacterium]|nr:hypothetical protein [Alphaproteobacteria bacterium]
MALNDLELGLMAFPQRWDGPSGMLSLNILLLPVGDPTAPLGGGPKFAGTAVSLVINLVSGLDALPSSGTVPDHTVPYVAQPPAVAPTLFSTLFNQLVAKGIMVTGNKLATPPPASARIKKSLPASYTAAFPFERPRSSDLSMGDGFGCALREQAPGLNAALPPPDTQIGWGQVISYALRQPVLAEDLGLIYRLTLPIPAARLAEGGYVWAALDTSSGANPWVADFKANPDTIKSYAARLPELDAAHARSLFAATLFPIVATPPSNLAQAQLEAEEYDDGFAQIVHANQPTTIDTATLAADQIAPGTEAGIQLGWDDEQVTVWLNSQIDLLRDRVGGTTNTPESPLGVQGYRVDVRQKGAPTWRSLCVVNGTLPFDQTSFGGAVTTSITGNEFWVAPAPVRPSADDNSTNDQPAWLPLYFAQWAGASLVLPDPVVQLLAYAVNAANTAKAGQPLPPPSLPNPNPDLTGVPALLYGNDYEFRVRLVDLTGGGPLATDQAVHPGPAPVTQVGFRRHVPPKSLEVVSSPTIPPFPAKPPATRTIQTLAVRRPRINYPEAVFAGVDPATFTLSNLGALIQDAWASGRAISVPDPDVDRFEVRIEARIPAHDDGVAGADPGDLDGMFRVIYSVEIPFPAGLDPTVTLTLVYTDGIDDIATLSAPVPGTVNLPIPTSRDIRVRLFPRAAARPNYYGSAGATMGLPSDYIVRQEAATEDALFPDNPELQLQAFYFQPGANIPQLLAQQLGLAPQGFMFSGSPGQRTVFGASGGIRHSVSADGGSLTFSNQTELLGQWIVALVLDLQRDWTWDGFGRPALSFQRGTANIGVIAFPRAVAAGAMGNPGQTPDRAHTRIVFFDAVNPQPAQESFPQELHLTYTVTANFTAAPPQQFTFPIRLPITTPPAQTPKIVSTGIAESPYHHSPDYAETTPRDRYLWVEFDRAIQDDDDTYFARVLAYGPDPLLAGALFPQPQASQMLPEATEPPLPIDPEPVRRIFSGQSADESGLDAMTQLVPADKVGVGKDGTFFLLPLPPGVTSEDLELFGFWTYEFRVGHVKFWSTAQGRYGRPLRVSGVQHPPPHLICAVERTKSGIGITAPYATAVYNGNRLYNFQAGDPQTRIWFMLYAQVLQADAASYRNILLAHLLGLTLRDQPGELVPGSSPQHGSSREPRAGIRFPEKLIDGRLALLGLPATTSLSVLAVEILPGPLSFPAGLARSAQDGAASGAAPEDPLGANLGLRRILRTSPLTAVPAIC